MLKLSVIVSLSTDRRHRLGRRREPWHVDAVARLLRQNDVFDVLLERLVRGAATDKGFDVVSTGREEARAKPSIRRQTQPAAPVAERLRDRRDETDLARCAVREAVPA